MLHNRGLINYGYRKGTILTSSLFILLLGISMPYTELNAESKSQDKKVTLPQNFIAALKEYCPGYEIVELKHLEKDLQDFFVKTYPGSHPGIVEGDFSGNGTKGYALLLRIKRQNKLFERLVVLMSAKQRGVIITVLVKDQEAYEGVENTYLRLVPKGSVVEYYEPEPGKQKRLTLKTPGIEFHKFESAAGIYYWDNGKFKWIQTTD